MSTATLAPLPVRRPDPVPRPRLTAPSRRPAPTLAAQLEQVADLVARDVPLPPADLAEAVATLARAASRWFDDLDPPAPDAPTIVQHRALGRLAARTAGREIVLDVGTVAHLEATLARRGAGPGPVDAPILQSQHMDNDDRSSLTS